ncbi:MAG TPA: o-succinylbenzoate--CoA ligase [Phycisphaerales bacterium]|nr:o-succinylbenzoate--CoA ligase [Phycisphaerales bacterium]
MLDNINTTAEKLLESGIVAGAPVAVLSENTAEVVVFVLACWRIGAVVVPLSSRYPAEKLRCALEAVNCQRVFVSSKFSSVDINAKVDRIDDFVDFEGNEITPPEFDSLNLNLEADASIIFTSGSSGSPRGVLHTLSNHYFSAAGADRNMPFEKNDRWLMTLPMYHISGFSLLMRSLLHGGTIVFPRPDESVVEAVEEFNFTHISLVPVQLSQLLGNEKCIDKLQNAKGILVGGSSVPAGLIKESISRGLPVYTTYGSTEMASQITTTGYGDAGKFKGTSGRLLKYRELKVSACGEILVKGKTLFKGYVSGGSADLPVDAQGYFHTGDMGRMDDDGNLYVTGRKDLMIVSGGENIFPEEIERAIANMSGALQAVVVPVADTTYGYRSVAFVKMRADQTLDEKGMRNELGRHIEKFKIPVAFYAWPDIAENSLKPDREAFARYAAELNK